jgi:hypothetical protein
MQLIKLKKDFEKVKLIIYGGSEATSVSFYFACLHNYKISPHNPIFEIYTKDINFRLQRN